MIKKILLSLFLVLLISQVFAVAPVTQVEAPISGSYSTGSTISIDLNISDVDTNSDYLTVDINYSTITTQGTGTNVIDDANLSSNFTCDTFYSDLNGYNMDINDSTSAGITCTYSWNTNGVPAACEFVGDGTSTQCQYYINAEIKDDLGGSIYASGASVFILTAGGDVSVTLDNFTTIINNSTVLADLVTLGVRDQGTLIGLAMGLLIAIGLLFALVIGIISVVPRLTDKVRRIK